MEKRTISPEEAARLGITTHHEQMENGEQRFRLEAADGSAYIRTEAGKNGAWQNSHRHNYALETYAVQTGWMALVEKGDTGIIVHIINPGIVVSTRPDVSHNVYLPARAVIHTIKHGGAVDGDWFADSDLDSDTKCLTEDDLLEYSKGVEDE